MPKPEFPERHAVEEGLLEVDAHAGGLFDGSRAIKPVISGVRSRADSIIAAVLPLLTRKAEAHGVPEAMQAAPEA